MQPNHPAFAVIDAAIHLISIGYHSRALDLLNLYITRYQQCLHKDVWERIYTVRKWAAHG